MALPVVASKYALLPDDDEDLDKKALRQKMFSKGEIASEQPSSSKSKKSKNKRKTKNENSDDSKELQALAFGKKKVEPQKSKIKAEKTPNDQQLASWLSHDKMVITFE